MSVFKTQTLLQIKLDTLLNVSAATDKKILYKKPDHTSGSWDATLEGTTVLVYQPVANDIDQDGVWKLQARVVLDGKVGYGEIVSQQFHIPLDQ